MFKINQESKLLKQGKVLRTIRKKKIPALDSKDDEVYKSGVV